MKEFEYEYHVQPVRNIIDYSFITEISPITGKERVIGPIPNMVLVDTIQDLREYRRSQQSLLREL